jgi:ABC-type transporter Mla MlaB component
MGVRRQPIGECRYLGGAGAEFSGPHRAYLYIFHRHPTVLPVALHLLLRLRATEKFGVAVKKIQMKELDGQLVLQVAGRLTGALVSELDGCWQAARARTPNCTISVDLEQVTRIDQAGWRLLQSMHASGVDFLRRALAMNALWSSRKDAWERRNTSEALHA